VRFFIGFLGAAAASPAVAWLHERTGGQDAVLLVLAGVAVLTAICTLAFPNRKEELQPELWAAAAGPRRVQPAE
jgi:LPXTG-motif cell wall-anchored protein